MHVASFTTGLVTFTTPAPSRDPTKYNVPMLSTYVYVFINCTRKPIIFPAYMQPCFNHLHVKMSLLYLKLGVVGARESSYTEKAIHKTAYFQYKNF